MVLGGTVRLCGNSCAFRFFFHGHGVGGTLSSVLCNVIGVSCVVMCNCYLHVIAVAISKLPFGFFFIARAR